MKNYGEIHIDAYIADNMKSIGLNKECNITPRNADGTREVLPDKESLDAMLNGILSINQAYNNMHRASPIDVYSMLKVKDIICIIINQDCSIEIRMVVHGKITTKSVVIQEQVKLSMVANIIDWYKIYAFVKPYWYILAVENEDGNYELVPAELESGIVAPFDGYCRYEPF